jgi:TetR/AcrR family tetracycline transcriptional repressor
MVEARRQPPGLTRQTIVDTALRVLDEVGIEGLTVRRIAGELGVQSPALYWHFRSKRELLDAMADAIVQAAGMGPPQRGETWRHWLARRARAYRASVLAHRDGARLVAHARMGPATITMFDEELRAMVDRGFSPVLALRTINVLSHYVGGFILQEQADPRDESDGTATDVVAGALAGRGPSTLLAAVHQGGPPLGEEAFEHGLRTILDGTAAALARRRPPNR